MPAMRFPNRANFVTKSPFDFAQGAGSGPPGETLWLPRFKHILEDALFMRVYRLHPYKAMTLISFLIPE